MAVRAATLAAFMLCDFGLPLLFDRSHEPIVALE
jgi:hypothetical protein